jgi:hypothetical protein
MVPHDQAFNVVENPEFLLLMRYTHHLTPTLSSNQLRIPTCMTAKRRVMKLVEETAERIRRFFSVRLAFPIGSRLNLSVQELESKVSIFLDARTSSNGYAFLAIVAHYITNDGKLGGNQFLGTWDHAYCVGLPASKMGLGRNSHA